MTKDEEIMAKKNVEEFVILVVQTLQVHSEQIVKIYLMLQELEDMNSKLMAALLRQARGNVN